MSQGSCPVASDFHTGLELGCQLRAVSALCPAARRLENGQENPCREFPLSL